MSFPQTMPPNTVYGRLGIGTGNGEAIPFATMAQQLGISIPFITPEMVDQSAGTGGDDTATLTKIGNLGRTAGFLDLVLTYGKTYQWTNPFLLAGIPNLRVRGEGAKLMNIRARDGGNNPVGLFVNYESLALANPFWPNGAGPYVGGAQYGAAINTVAAGSPTITVTSGNCPLGPVFIYGFDRLGSQGFPPCPTCFEYNFVVSAVGSVGTLLNLTQHNYDAQWPTLATSGGLDGPAKVLSCNANIVPWTQLNLFEDINFIPNPAFPASLSTSNGSITLSGGENIIANRCTAAQGNATVGRNIFFNDHKCTGFFQGDKCIEIMQSKRGHYCGAGGSTSVFGAGAGIKKFISEDDVVTGFNGLFPIEHLLIKGGRWVTRAQDSSASLIGDASIGCAKITIDKTVFVPLSTSDRVMEDHVFSSAVSIQATSGTSTTISMTRTVYNASLFCRAIRIGSVLRNVNGTPAFRVVRMPYTTGDPLTGDVWIDGDNLSNFAGGDTLYLPVTPDKTIIDPLYDGPFASQVTSWHGTGFFAAPFPSGRVRDRYITDSSIRITSDMSYFPRGSNLFRQEIGNKFRIARGEISITRAAASGGTVSMLLQYADGAGTLNNLFNAVDLKTVGRRVFDDWHYATLGADDTTGSSLGTTDAQQLYWVDGGAALVQPNQPEWSVTYYGAWAAGYEGQR